MFQLPSVLRLIYSVAWGIEDCAFEYSSFEICCPEIDCVCPHGGMRVAHCASKVGDRTVRSRRTAISVIPRMVFAGNRARSSLLTMVTPADNKPHRCRRAP